MGSRTRCLLRFAPLFLAMEGQNGLEKGHVHVLCCHVDHTRAMGSVLDSGLNPRPGWEPDSGLLSFSKGFLDRTNPNELPFEREIDPKGARVGHERASDARGYGARFRAPASRWEQEEATRRCLEDVHTAWYTSACIEPDRRGGRRSGGHQQHTRRQILACCRRGWHCSAMDGMDLDGVCCSYRSKRTPCSRGRGGLRNLGSTGCSKEAPGRTGAIEHAADGDEACKRSFGGW